jgi:autotransporter family porin
VCLRVSTQDGSPIHLLADVVGYVKGSVDRAAPPAGPTPPPPPPAPPSSGRFETLPPGSALPSDAECAARVRPAPEVRPSNAVPNATRGVSPNDVYPRVTGDFTGTTDEILQWVACKWGIDEDIVRAQIVKESWWQMSANGDNGESWGLGQVRVPYHQSAFENDNARRSSAYNVDYTYAVWRACYEGELTWLNTVERGRDYAGGDAWGCLGVWFSGRWYTQPAITYIEGGPTNGYGDVGVRQHVQRRTWEQAGAHHHAE